MSSKLSFPASGGVNGFTSLVCIAASVGFVARAGASDLDRLAAKAPPEMPDLTCHRITLIGAIDVSEPYDPKARRMREPFLRRCP
jgi:hypothetical protein